MRIANLSPVMFPRPEAMSVSVMKTCEAMASEGHEVVLFAGRLRSDPQNLHAYYGCARSFEVVPIATRRTGRLNQLYYSARVVGRQQRLGRFDALLGRDVVAMFVAARGTPFVVEMHGPPRTRNIHVLLRRLLRRRTFAGLVVQHEVLRSHYLDLYPWLGECDVAVAYNGGDPTRLPYESRPSSWPGRSGRMQAGYVGSLGDEKGIGFLMHIAEGVPDVDVHVVGGTDDQVRRWRSHSTATNLHFHGVVAPTRLPTYYAALDCLLAPPDAPIAIRFGRASHWQLSSKLFEYMAHGKAICASDTRVVREVLEHERTALLAPPGQIGGWVQALLTLAADQELRAALGREARRVLESRFTWAHRARTILGMFERDRTSV